MIAIRSERNIDGSLLLPLQWAISLSYHDLNLEDEMIQPYISLSPLCRGTCDKPFGKIYLNLGSIFANIYNMKWEFVYYSGRVKREILALPKELLAEFVAIQKIMGTKGSNLGMP